MIGRTPSSKEHYFPIAIALILALGILLQSFLIARSWIAGDQARLLTLGLDYAETGRLLPMSRISYGGGSIPGGLLQILIGLPLSVWQDYRAPAVLIGIFQFLGAVLLMRTLREAAGTKHAAVFLLVYWLSPWRLYHSGFVWEPAYMFLPASIHLWSSWKLREKAGTLHSAVMTAVLVLSFQLHGSFLFLVVLTMLLALKKLIRLHAGGALLGFGIGVLPLLPTLTALARGASLELLPTRSFIGRGLLTVYPVLKGALYWLRLGSLDIGRRLRDVVFLDERWGTESAENAVIHAAVILLYALAMASIVLSFAASWRMLVRGRQATGEPEGGEWLISYARSAFLAVLAACALSPVTIQGWHLVIALHAACIPVAFWITEGWATMKKPLRYAVVLFIVLRIPVMIVTGLGSDMYRKGPLPDDLEPAVKEELLRITR
jgi:hypothetical protein